LDSVKQHGRFTDNHLGRSTGLIVGGYSAMFVAPSLWLSVDECRRRLFCLSLAVRRR
jgi:hypothetical protein